MFPPPWAPLQLGGALNFPKSSLTCVPGRLVPLWGLVFEPVVRCRGWEAVASLLAATDRGPVTRQAL